ncbi:hypothetical protein [Chitinophaga sp.]|uniref:hypothetical protein n=1 Tax=Chitinophaga sp. TaxID=1869181 RepID=UPI002F9282E8
MKKIQTLFLVASLCFAMSSANAAAGSNSLWYMSKSFSNYTAAARLSPISVSVNVVTLLGVPVKICSALGQTLITSPLVYKLEPTIISIPIQCSNYQQQPVILDVAAGDVIEAWGYVLSTGFNIYAQHTVTTADISAGTVTVNLLLQ